MIVFFVRKANDVDHLTPVVYRLSRDASDPVLVLCLSPRYDIHSDYRLRFLTGLPRVTVAYQFQYHAPTIWHWALAKLLCGPATFRRRGNGHRPEWSERLRMALGRGVFLAVMAPFFEQKYKFLRKAVYHDRWAEGLLRKAQATLLVFDWAKPYQHTVGAIQAAARRLDLTTVALPHGVDVYVGDLRGATARKTGSLPDYAARLSFDIIVVPHADQAAYYERCGVARHKLRVLGSARFCREWVQKNLELSPPLSFDTRPRAHGRLRVVLMDKPTANLAGPVENAVAAIAAMPKVDLVVRPATRNEATTLSRWPEAVRISRDSSARLIEWCDVVIGTMSSILIEPLIRGKPVICPLFMSDVRTVFTEEGGCILVRSVDELVTTLEQLCTGTATSVFPTRETVEALLDRLVRGGRRQADVLGEYARLLTELECKIPKWRKGDREAPVHG